MALGQACKRKRAASPKASEGVRDGSPKGRDPEACDGARFTTARPGLPGDAQRSEHQKLHRLLNKEHTKKTQPTKAKTKQA